MGSSPISGTKRKVELKSSAFFYLCRKSKMGLEKGVKANVQWTFGSTRVELAPVVNLKLKRKLLF